MRPRVPWETRRLIRSFQGKPVAEKPASSIDIVHEPSDLDAAA